MRCSSCSWWRVACWCCDGLASCEFTCRRHWGAAIEFAGFTCPLTPIEKAWRRAAGEHAYEGGFVEHYVTAALYPAGLTRPTQVVLGALVLGVNVWVYWKWWRRPKVRTP